MKTQCPKCKASGRIDNSKIPEKGVFVRCPKCQERFYLKKEIGKAYENSINEILKTDEKQIGKRLKLLLIAIRKDQKPITSNSNHIDEIVRGNGTFLGLLNYLNTLGNELHQRIFKLDENIVFFDIDQDILWIEMSDFIELWIIYALSFEKTLFYGGTEECHNLNNALNYLFSLIEKAYPLKGRNKKERKRNKREREENILRIKQLFLLELVTVKIEGLQNYISSVFPKKNIKLNDPDSIRKIESKLGQRMEKIWEKRYKHIMYKHQKVGIFSKDYEEIEEHRVEDDNTERRSISTGVRREVWRRDRGQCVKCGSRNRLEYDHIIPVSKGGNNSVRNIELLCQECNRKKSNKIV